MTSHNGYEHPVDRVPGAPAPGALGWLRVGITVCDVQLRRCGEIMAIAWPPYDLRQARRAWLRPPGGGREWNPRIDDLRPPKGGAT